MDRRTTPLVILAVILCAAVVLGEVFTYGINTHNFSSEAEFTSGTLNYSISSSGSDTYSVVLMDENGFEPIKDLHIYVDERYDDHYNDVRKKSDLLYTEEQYYSEQIMKQLSEKMIENGIKILDINIMDFDFSEAYIQAIEAKQVAEQAKLKSKIEQEQKTIEAEAQAKRDLIKADAELQVSQKEAAANKAISQSLTPELIEYNKIQKWNGELPQITGADSIIAVNGSEKK